MIHCAPLNCTKSSSKKSDNSLSCFKFLKDPRRRKNLIAKLKRANLLKDKNLHVCRKHFEENCFQRDLKVSSIFLIACLSAKYVLLFLIGIYSMQGWTAATRHGVTRKEAQKWLQDTENLFRKNLQLKDVC